MNSPQVTVTLGRGRVARKPLTSAPSVSRRAVQARLLLPVTPSSPSSATAMYSDMEGLEPARDLRERLGRRGGGGGAAAAQQVSGVRGSVHQRLGGDSKRAREGEERWQHDLFGEDENETADLRSKLKRRQIGTFPAVAAAAGAGGRVPGVKWEGGAALDLRDRLSGAVLSSAFLQNESTTSHGSSRPGQSGSGAPLRVVAAGVGARAGAGAGAGRWRMAKPAPAASSRLVQADQQAVSVSRTVSMAPPIPQTASRHRAAVAQQHFPAPAAVAMAPAPPLSATAPPLGVTAPASASRVSPLLSFLRSLGLEKYHSVLVKEEIDIAALRHMKEEDLRELGIPMGPRKKILLAIAAAST
eukprot:TRINITY_DN224_c0_g2_i1.p1 TRINITY_DN224_c0_g2~~TRINITY_DN224_c0_g2_i1.p1  ORF type:complete len:357 (+),score=89.38 TRINITY_DN224_c0_g2_i1:144-1214(+)